MFSAKRPSAVTSDMLEDAEKRLHSMVLTLQERLSVFESRMETQVHDLQKKLENQGAQEPVLEKMRTEFKEETQATKEWMRDSVQDLVQSRGGSRSDEEDQEDRALIREKERMREQQSRTDEEDQEDRTVRRGLTRESTKYLGSHETGNDFDDVYVTLVDEDMDAQAPTKAYRTLLKQARGSSATFELKPDIWGAVTFLIIKDIPAMGMSEMGLENQFRIAVVLLSYVMNLTFQIMFLWWMAVSVMLPHIQNVQEIYKLFRSKAFDSEGNFDRHAFESLGESRARLCELAVARPVFLSMCLLLWIIRCLDEFRAINRRKISLDLLPQLPDGVAPTHMVHDIDFKVGDFIEEERNLIVCLDNCTRFRLSLLIFIPRAIVAACLLLIGTAFLSASESATDLILNSLALAFVFDIDGLLFHVFMPIRFRQALERTIITCPANDEKKSFRKNYQLYTKEVKKGYVHSSFLMILTVVYLFVWLKYQPILPGFEWDIRSHCLAYLPAFNKLPCAPWDGNCFST